MNTTEPSIEEGVEMKYYYLSMVAICVLMGLGSLGVVFASIFDGDWTRTAAFVCLSWIFHKEFESYKSAFGQVLARERYEP